MKHYFILGFGFMINPTTSFSVRSQGSSTQTNRIDEIIAVYPTIDKARITYQKIIRNYEIT